MQLKPKIAVIGLAHGHVSWITHNVTKYDEFDLVGIAEKDQQLMDKYKGLDGLSDNLFYANAKEMLEHTRPDAVAVFTSTFDHLEAVQLCAPLGIHVMVEKPLAVSLDHAREMAQLAKEHNIELITNFETSWYATTHQAYRLLKENKLGKLRKLVVHDGHNGPKERGCSEDFLNWLLDPELNGGGAIMDFGCYGINLMTWLMDNQKPLTVSATTQQLKDDSDYARVDDEATIVLTYPDAQTIIQGSWNWPFDRKDMELYGETGYIQTIDKNRMRRRFASRNEIEEELEPLATPERDPFPCLTAVVRDGFQPSGLWSLENNLIVMEVLDAARESARTGQRIHL